MIPNKQPTIDLAERVHISSEKAVVSPQETFPVVELNMIKYSTSVQIASWTWH